MIDAMSISASAIRMVSTSTSPSCIRVWTTSREMVGMTFG
jgi:hypothetical protein